MKNLDFKIEKSTMRELTQIEVNHVAGAADTADMPTWMWASTEYCVMLWTMRGDDDGIFDDGFEDPN